ncbi:RNA polymerase sigma factor [Roseibacillus ishigakijimensis]|uniref:Sigma-70 family RNA polymerase sigma factor n=1 Tax=Roseibacillus ishigakijimensis TaxID=454146 RepID=A0A934VIH6_9BACT|nr:sigma-70 family RNA polymerase sigma factor [Roseibacillus ishigakijimensis]MBK1835083.1 sigma-70 family RNA polymerase sigma factor [Roseibacillus ishigakijimensis]
MKRTRNLAQEWKEWLAREGGRLLMYARQRTGSLEEAEDVLQDSLIRLWGYQKERGYCPPDVPLAFSVLRLVAMDAGRKKGRRKKRDEKVIQLHDYDEHWLDPTLEDDEEALLLRRAVEGLSDKLREVVTLKAWSGLTFAEIGAILKISHNTAASRYRYALELLQRELNHLKEERHA